MLFLVEQAKIDHYDDFVQMQVCHEQQEDDRQQVPRPMNHTTKDENEIHQYNHLLVYLMIHQLIQNPDQLVQLDKIILCSNEVHPNKTQAIYHLKKNSKQLL